MLFSKESQEWNPRLAFIGQALSMSVVRGIKGTVVVDESLIRAKSGVDGDQTGSHTLAGLIM